MTLNKKAIEEEFVRLTANKRNNFARILYHLKRNFDEWSLSNLSKSGYPEMKIGYMPFLMNIGSEGITNTALAKKVRVTKQAMSKTLKELENLKLVELKPNPADARSAIITLTLFGMQMVIHCRHRVEKLTEIYIQAIGKSRYADMLDALNAIIDIHESMDDKE